jgi:hypothetical protein
MRSQLVAIIVVSTELLDTACGHHSEELCSG